MILIGVQQLICILMGLASGFAVGTGLVAVLVVLRVIPRLTQLTYSRKCMKLYEIAVILGAILFTWMDMYSVHLQISGWVMGIIGLLAGGFVGMLAAALTEVVNVIPIMAKRLGLEGYVLCLMMALVFGKVVGSWLGWLYFS